MNKDQINSLVRTAVKVVGTFMIAHGYTTSANLLNGEDVIGAIILVVGLVMSHFSHKETPPTPPPA